MKYMVIVKGTRESESGAMPDGRMLAEMGAFNEELAAAGVMLAGEGLHPSANGARVRFGADGSRSISTGPFEGPRSLVCGYWIWQVESREEALDWVRRAPSPFPGEGEVEIRLMGCLGPRDPAMENLYRERPRPMDGPDDCFNARTESGRENAMRFMVIVKATKDSEAGVMPEEKLLAAMTAFNEELVKAGVMLAGEGLQPSSKGARVKFSADGSRKVVDGPFAETKELIAGFWLWQVKSMEECLEWVKRCPAPFDGESEIEVRRVFEDEDFGAEFTPELREREGRLREQLAGRKS